MTKEAHERKHEDLHTLSPGGASFGVSLHLLMINISLQRKQTRVEIILSAVVLQGLWRKLFFLCLHVLVIIFNY